MHFILSVPFGCEERDIIPSIKDNQMNYTYRACWISEAVNLRYSAVIYPIGGSCLGETKAALALTWRGAQMQAEGTRLRKTWSKRAVAESNRSGV